MSNETTDFKYITIPMEVNPEIKVYYAADMLNKPRPRGLSKPMKVSPELADIIGKLYKSFVCKRVLVIYVPTCIYQSQSEVVKVIFTLVNIKP